ncbi:MAG: hypothetical protein U9Q92_01995 [archaeon]|nr:hypothetical protein [archaeon]
MGFLDKIKKLVENLEKGAKEKREKDMPPKDVRLDYKKAKTWLDSSSGPVLQDIEAHVSDTTNSLRMIKARLEKDIIRLKNAKAEETQDKRLERAIINNKKAILSKLNTFCHNTRISKVTAAESPEFFDNIKGQMSHLMTDTSKNFYFVNTGFQSVSGDIKKDLFEFGKAVDEAIEYLKPFKSKIESIDESYKIIEEMDAEIERGKNLEDDVAREEEKLEKLIRSEKALEKDIKKMEKGNEVKALSKLNEEHKKILEEITALEGKIVYAVSPISRGLRKYSRVAQLAGKEEERLLALYIDEPALAVGKDEGLKLFKKIIPELELYISKGSITLKDKIKVKTLGALSKLKGACELDELKQKLAGMKKKETAIKKDIESDKTMQKKRDLEEKHAKLSADIELSKSSISGEQKTMETLMQNMGNRITALEKKMGAIGSYNVKISFKSIRRSAK